MRRKLWIAAFGLVALLGVLGYVLFRPLAPLPLPADFACYDIAQGAYVPLAPPPQAFGVGLTYAAHIEETASSFDSESSPPIFEKRPQSTVRTGAQVRLPTGTEMTAAVGALEPGLGNALIERFPNLDPLLDYEVEMGFVLLDDIDASSLDDPSFAPRLGFFIANDLSARSVQILGEGQGNRRAFWSASKSFPGFMPIADRAWVPEAPLPNGIPCLEIETLVNGEVVQRQSTTDMIYTPRQMLRFVREAFPDVPLDKGTVVLSGTPSGVAMTTPRWLVRLAGLLHLSRFQKHGNKLEDAELFLKAGDRVVVRGQGLGKVNVTVAP
ncbi:MAG: fumarylacetoacetate hydrolase family protein [Myxococcota bacterium]